jgi:hypothetical protein
MGARDCNEVYDFEVDKQLELGDRQDEAEAEAARLIDQMRMNFDAEAQDWEPLEGSFGLRDPATSTEWAKRSS